MGITHIKLESIDSTQSWLKENISKYLDEDVLVSTYWQTHGIGRHGNKWTQFGNSLAFSFSLRPAEPLTMTPLEVSVHLVNFFQERNINLLLKWPNDLLIMDKKKLKKVGGILCHYQNNKQLIVGIGLNLDQKSIPENSGFKFSAGSINLPTKNEGHTNHSIPYHIYEYILENRMDLGLIQKLWFKYCCHTGKEVRIIDGKNEVSGIFKGLGSKGEALLSDGHNTSKFIAGSLYIKD